MRTNSPTKLVWYICLILLLVGVAFFFIPSVAVYGIWVIALGLVLLLLATLIKGL
jgi:hypothetical protein